MRSQNEIKIVDQKLTVNQRPIYTAPDEITYYILWKDKIILHHLAPLREPVPERSIIAIDYHGNILWEIDGLHLKEPDQFTSIEIYNNQLVGHLNNTSVLVDLTNGKVIDTFKSNMYFFHCWLKDCRALFTPAKVHSMKESLFINNRHIFTAPGDIITFEVYSDKIILFFKVDPYGPLSKRCIFAVNYQGNLLWQVEDFITPVLSHYRSMMTYNGRLRAFIDDYSIIINTENGTIIEKLFTK